MSAWDHPTCAHCSRCRRWWWWRPLGATRWRCWACDPPTRDEVRGMYEHAWREVVA